MRSFFALVLALALGGAAPPAASAQTPLYTLDRSVPLPSSGSGWDYIRMEPGTSRLFIARDADGLTVFDVDAQRSVATVANSTGANGPLLIPAVSRGYAAMTDGSLLAFDLRSLKPLSRIMLADASTGLNSAVYVPATREVIAITGQGARGSTWFVLDAATGRRRREVRFPFRKMDDPASDGAGRLFAPVRLDRLILKLDARTLKEEARWPAPCNVSKVRFQASANRLLGACYGDAPLFFAMNPDTGEVTATVPIGRGMDGFVVDEARRRIITSDGQDAVLTVIGQDGPDSYRLLGTVSTRPNARMMTADERNGRLLLVAADHTLTPAPGGEPVKSYHPGAFTVLSYQPR